MCILCVCVKHYRSEKITATWICQRIKQSVENENENLAQLSGNETPTADASCGQFSVGAGLSSAPAGGAVYAGWVRLDVSCKVTVA